jgi:hypothetical protein
MKLIKLLRKTGEPPVARHAPLTPRARAELRALVGPDADRFEAAQPDPSAMGRRAWALSLALIVLVVAAGTVGLVRFWPQSGTPATTVSPSASPSATPTPTPTPTAPPTPTTTPTPSPTASPESSAWAAGVSNQATGQAGAPAPATSSAPAPAPTPTPTPTPTPSETPTPTETASETPDDTATPTAGESGDPAKTGEPSQETTLPADPTVDFLGSWTASLGNAAVSVYVTADTFQFAGACPIVVGYAVTANGGWSFAAPAQPTCDDEATTAILNALSRAGSWSSVGGTININGVFLSR